MNVPSKTLYNAEPIPWEFVKAVIYFTAFIVKQNAIIIEYVQDLLHRIWVER